MRNYYVLFIDHLQGQELGGIDMQLPESVLSVGMVEAARRLGLSVRTIATLIKRNELPSRKIGRRRLISVRDLETFIKRDHRIK
jgi:excisionase family DNA binding protein